MGFEIDFLPVGDGSKGGDAIALRYGNLTGPRNEQTVVVVDGGFLDDGEALVELIKTRYQTEQVDFVISTHPDRDHIKGLQVVLKELKVSQLLMHKPEEHDSTLATAASESFEQKSAAFGERLAKSLNDTEELIAVANDEGVEIVEPFAGMATGDGSLRILGPSRNYYEELLEEMKGASAKTAAEQKSLLATLLSKAKETALNLVPETLWHETLTEESDVSASNNSSVITLLTVDGHQLLLTGDAGADALHQALDLLEAEGFAPGNLRFVQVPHHGSRHNVTPSVLDRLLGEKGQAAKLGTAYVSAPPENPEKKHPAKKTTNAFRRRGYHVYETAGRSIWHNLGAPARASYSDIDPLPFHDQVEAHDD